MQSTSPKVGTALKAGMYLLSLWLLFLLIFVNKVEIPICLGCPLVSPEEIPAIAERNILPIVCLGLLLVSLLFQLWFKHLITGAKIGPQKLGSVESKGSEHLVFLATYVIPLVGFSLDNPRQIINFVITLIIIGSIYVKTNLFYANPTLSLLGFRVYEADLNGKRSILISTDELNDNDVINYVVLDQRTFFVKKSPRINR